MSLQDTLRIFSAYFLLLSRFSLPATLQILRTTVVELVCEYLQRPLSFSRALSVQQYWAQCITMQDQKRFLKVLLAIAIAVYVVLTWRTANDNAHSSHPMGRSSVLTRCITWWWPCVPCDHHLLEQSRLLNAHQRICFSFANLRTSFRCLLVWLTRVFARVAGPFTECQDFFKSFKVGWNLQY